MFSSVDYVRSLCRNRGIPIAQLERECGFSNGYLNPKKLSKLPYDRAQTIAAYLGVSATAILTGEETPNPAVTEEDIKFALFGGDSDITREMYEEVKQFAAYVKHRQKGKTP